MSAPKPTMSTVSCYYTDKELQKYTKQLADLGGSGRSSGFLHKLASIAVDIVLEKNKNSPVE